MQSRSRAARLACASVAGVLLLASCGRSGAKGAPEAPAAPVTVARAERREVPVELRAIGNVEASSVVEIRARVGGTLEAVHFTEGAVVSKGKPLLTIDRRPFEVALARAQATLARDRVIAKNAREEVDRYGELVAKEYVTREQYDRSVAMAAAAEALVKADEADVDAARLGLGYCTIASPITGRAGDVLVRPGNLVKADSDDPLVVLRATKPVFVAFAIPEARLDEVRAHASAGPLAVEVAPPGATGPKHRGTLSFLDNAVSVTTGTIRLKATFPNEDDALWPGQFVDVVLRLAVDADALTIPAQAVQSGQQGDFVFVVKDDGTVESRPVRVARRYGDDAILAEGVKEGETVVTEGQLRLGPGAKVTVKGPS